MTTMPDGWEAWVTAMRAEPAIAGLMCVLADWLDEREAMVKCEACRGDTILDMKPYFAAGKVKWNVRMCDSCHGVGYVSNGMAARAEAFRLLGETGKVGVSYGYSFRRSPHEWPSDSPEFAAMIPDQWYNAIRRMRNRTGYKNAVDERLALVEAYAKADPDARRKWYAETTALTPDARSDNLQGQVKSQ